MSDEQRRLSAEAAGEAAGVELGILWHYAELELITRSTEGYSDDDLAELRRVRRLREQLELGHPAIEIILRMRRRIQALQDEIRRLHLAAAEPRRPTRETWVDAEWDELLSGGSHE